MLNFFIFSLILVSSFTIIFATNVVYAVLQLIVTYTLVSFRLIFLDLEFFSTVFVIVCAGGMGVLFLFVIMTFSKKASNPFFLLTYYNQFFILMLLYIFGLVFWYSFQYFITFGYDFWTLYTDGANNYTHAEFFLNLLINLGYNLYFQYPFFIFGGGFFLFFALIAAVFLTATKNSYVLD